MRAHGTGTQRMGHDYVISPTVPKRQICDHVRISGAGSLASTVFAVGIPADAESRRVQLKLGGLRLLPLLFSLPGLLCLRNQMFTLMDSMMPLILVMGLLEGSPVRNSVEYTRKQSGVPDHLEATQGLKYGINSKENNSYVHSGRCHVNFRFRPTGGAIK